MKPFAVVVANLPALPDATVPVAASRGGAIGLLNLEQVTQRDVADAALGRLIRLGHGALALKLDTESPLLATLSSLPDSLRWVILATGFDPSRVPEILQTIEPRGIRLFLECSETAEVRDLCGLPVHGFVAKGHEAPGRVGDSTTFVLLQALLRATDRPIWAYGGIGIHAAAACAVVGAAGVVLDEQFALAAESLLPSRVGRVLRQFQGDETIVVGRELGAAFRVYRQPGADAVERLQRLETELVDDAEPARAFLRQTNSRMGWGPLTQNVWPLGQGAVFAAPLAHRYRNTVGILRAYAAAPGEHVRQAVQARALAESSPLAVAHGTRYPILQGPMTRVSDRAEFAEAIAAAGGLPFLALALLPAEQVLALLNATASRLGSRPWGVGVLGFIPAALQQEQLTAIEAVRPCFAIIAGGRPDQAARLEAAGIHTYLHVPTPALLRGFLQDGARRFIFEGRECGGHVGPRSSFVLWDCMVDTLTDAIDAGLEATDLYVVFAGGIHDDRSGAMAAVIAAPLTARGVRFGVLLGTAYLFADEAVTSGAIVSGFRREILACERTVLLESGPGHATRCADTPIVGVFRQAKRNLSARATPAKDMRDALEQLNLGRLRIASKAMVRNPAYGQSAAALRYLEVPEDRQHQEGLYMIGQVATLRSSCCTLAEIHAAVAAGTEVLAHFAATVEAPADSHAAHVERPCDIAIVGIGALLPGAKDYAEFWSNILDKVDSVTEIPAERFDSARYFDSDRTAPDKIYSRWGGFLPEITFDPLRYGIPPAALRSIDPLQLLTLEVVRSALADAGLLDRDFPRERTSVILGAGGGLGDLGMQYGLRSMLPMYLQSPRPEIMDALPEWTEDSFAGILLNVVAGRVANRFDLGGVNYVVDAACGSSLAALSLAVRELVQGTSDIVITGGADTTQSPFGYLCFSKTQALSPRGRSRAFDASADGIAISEGIAVVVLKRLADAERDGDRIYAVVRGVAGSSDGRDKSLTAPRPDGQMRALTRAYAQSGVSPTTVGLVEAHGTGTAVGDVSEVESLRRVYEAAGAVSHSVALGSVKSAIGHTKSAAGMAGLIKIALALYHQVIPPTLHVESPNPKVTEPGSPFFLPTEPLPWIRRRTDTPRRAAVSAFGFGGTNFHAVVEEYRDGLMDAGRIPTRLRWPAEILVWSAPSTEALDASLEPLTQALAAGALPDLKDLAAAAWQQTCVGTAAGYPVRLALVVGNHDQLRKVLAAVRVRLRDTRTGSDVADGFYLWRDAVDPGQVALLFPGQGSQQPGMLRDLALYFPEFRDSLELANERLAGCLDRALSDLVFPPPAWSDDERQRAREALTDTQIAQPALGAMEFAAFRMLVRLGLRADMVAGHSYGEYVALAAAGAFDEPALYEISEARGRAIKESAGDAPGTMVAVVGEQPAVIELLAGMQGVWIANLNSPHQTVIAGRAEDVGAARAVLGAHGFKSMPLNVAAAFHTPLMEPALGRLADALAALPLRSPSLTVFSNALAAPYPTDPSAIRNTLITHLVRPVQFGAEIEAMFDRGARVFIEVGPGRVLSGLAERILDGRPAVVLPLDRPGAHGLVSLLHLLAQVFVRGVPLDLDPLFAGRSQVLADVAEVLAQARPLLPPSHLWRVNGGLAYPLTASPVGGRAPTRSPMISPLPEAPAKVPAESIASVAHTPPAGVPAVAVAVSAADVRGPDADPVMAQFQALMSQFLTTQATVMTAYLQGVGEAPPEGNRGSAALFPLGRSTPPCPTSPALPAAAPATAVATPAAAGPPTDHPSPTRSATGRDVVRELLGIIAERTGYPPETIGLDQGLEADLGIDSIKRVEILNALLRGGPTAEQNQLRAVMDRMTAATSLRALAALITEAIGAGPGALPDSAIVPTATSPDAPAHSDVGGLLLELVIEHTGYPREAIGLDIGLESDLGIDSIKRVEILNALHRRLPDTMQPLVQAVMDRLTASRTLRDMIRLLTTDNVSGSLPEPLVSVGTRSPTVDLAVSTELSGSSGNAAPRWVMQALAMPPVIAGPPGRAGRLAVLTDDGRGIATAVAVGLRARGERVVLLRDSVLPAADPDSDVYPVDLTDPAGIEAVIAAIQRDRGPIGAVIHLAPLASAVAFPELSLDAWRLHVRRQVKSLHVLARACAENLRRAGRAASALLVAATAMGGAFGLGDRADRERIDPVHAGLAAMMRTVAMEWPEVRCKAVDLDGASSSQVLAVELLEELAADTDAVQIGRRGAVRVTPVAVRAELQSDRHPEIASDWVILLTGGARGITAQIALDLARRFQPTLVLVGRSPVPEPEREETAGIEDPRALKARIAELIRLPGETPQPARIETEFRRIRRDRELRRNLEALSATGARIDYVALDVRDEREFTAFIDGIYKRYQRLDAVIHGAGVIEDKLLVDKTPESFDRVVETKTDGAFMLARRLDLASLKALVFMTSVSATYGNPGQADYAAANGVLNGLAARLSACWPARVVGLNWGPWDSVGMVSEELRRQFLAKGILMVPVAAGAAALARELSASGPDQPVLVVGDGPWRDAPIGALV